jgi:hypothetical protein
MTVKSAFNDIDDDRIPDYDAADSEYGEGVTPSDPEGAFNAALYYFAADLQELAKGAPAYKAEPLAALVRLMRALADT